MNSLWSGKDSDLQLQINNGKVFNIHRFILMKRSQLLAQFIRDHGDSNSNLIQTNIENVTYNDDTMEQILKYLYTGEYETNLFDDPLTSLFINKDGLTLEHSQSHLSRLQKDLIDSFTSDSEESKLLGCDVKLMLPESGDVIHAHRSILNTNSPYFNKMLTSGLLESNQDEIVIEEMPLSTMRPILNFIYTCSVDRVKLQINAGNCIDIMITAEIYTEDLLSKVAEYIAAANLDSDNVEYVRELCIRYNKKTLLEQCDALLSRLQK
jgi:hypothetical protein